MLYSDFAFWLYGQPIETQIIVMYLIVFASIGLFLLNYWYEDWLAKNYQNYLTEKNITLYKKTLSRK